MTGICGWFGATDGNGGAIIADMCDRITWAGARSQMTVSGADFALGAKGPAGTIGAFEFGPIKIALHGHAFWNEGAPRTLPLHELCARIATTYRERGPEALSLLGGDFALAIIDTDRRQLLLAIDRIGIRNLIYRAEQDGVIFAATLDALAAHPEVKHEIDPQAIYNYVYFHMVPGPGTIFRRSLRLLPGHYLLAEAGDVVVKRYWEMPFDEDSGARVSALERQFRSVLSTGVGAVASAERCGTFLSGGTDSSTVTGVLSQQTAAAVKTFSIGFDAAGYDEMKYAHIAAAHFGTEQHEYYVTPLDVVAALPMVAAEYDQPFGNASAVPTYFCGKLAADDGVARMLAGDGGDELFGGNARYAKQYQFSLYERIPASLRTGLVEPALRSRIGGMLPLSGKGRSYVAQARLPMPARYDTHNLLEHLGPENVFDRDFLSTVDRRVPLGMLTAVHDATHATSLINRMIAIDLKFTLADNDLPKVTRMCDRAGVDVAFPLLHDSVVSFSATLAPDLKLRGTRLRYFFKEALRDFLPPEIIAKQKHGFGLPTGPWLASYSPLRAMAKDALASLARRNIFDADFLERLVDRQLHEHAAYYGTMLWILMMLELWFQEHVDRR